MWQHNVHGNLHDNQVQEMGVYCITKDSPLNRGKVPFHWNWICKPQFGYHQHYAKSGSSWFYKKYTSYQACVSVGVCVCVCERAHEREREREESCQLHYLSIFISLAFITCSKNDNTELRSVPGFFFPCNLENCKLDKHWITRKFMEIIHDIQTSSSQQIPIA